MIAFSTCDDRNCGIAKLYQKYIANRFQHSMCAMQKPLF